jgi:hypothetical protein
MERVRFWASIFRGGTRSAANEQTAINSGLVENMGLVDGIKN